jgi:HD-like signal output (HDOD) protein
MAVTDNQASAESKTPTQRDASTAAFEFVRDLSAELSASKIELPSYPEVASQVQKVLSEENCSSERVVRVMGAEPVLATRVLTMANSAALNPGGQQITELRTAVTRLGFDALRAATVSFVMAQLRSAGQYKNLQRYLDALWQQSVLVASLCFVVSRRVGKINSDTAMLTGLVHGVGKLYILTRSVRHPALFADQEMYQHIVNDWHGSIAKVLLENWGMAEDIINAVHSHTDDSRQTRGSGAVLADVLEVALTLAPCKQLPELLAPRIGPLKAAARLELTPETCEALMAESAEELAALRTALGQ